MIKNKFFLGLEEIDSDHFEVTSTRKSFAVNTPKTLGVWILGLGKLAMLKAYHEYLDVYFDRKDWELMQMDTDSIYFACSKPSLDEFEASVRPSLADQFKQNRDRYMIPKTVANMPGRMKLEYIGTGMICTAPKCYYVWNEDPSLGAVSSKNSQKGSQKKNNHFTKDDYERSLMNGEIVQGVNRGFMMRDQDMLRYKLQRSALVSFYAKRRCYGMRTKPLLYREDAFESEEQ